MAIQITVKETEAQKPIPENLYLAKITEITESNGNFGPFLKIVFEIAEGEYQGTTRSLVASKKLSKGKDGKSSKLLEVVKSLTGAEPNKGETLDVESLIGKMCKVFVSNGKEKDGVVYQNVSQVISV